ncbi:MAG: hypothetical protein K2X43_00110 [Hyphomonadaceae bacterium]|nr:hypothetical protein [Hyphomonadaceae bacterium]
MLVGFVFWYRGLALGGSRELGSSSSSSLSSASPLAGLLLGEQIAWTMIAVTGMVALCVTGARRYA